MITLRHDVPTAESIEFAKRLQISDLNLREHVANVTRGELVLHGGTYRVKLFADSGAAVMPFVM